MFFGQADRVQAGEGEEVVELDSITTVIYEIVLGFSGAVIVWIVFAALFIPALAYLFYPIAKACTCTCTCAYR